MFHVAKSLSEVFEVFKKGDFFLIEDNWDDFGYKTSYGFYHYGGKGERFFIGLVKIGQTEMKEGQRRADLPTNFEYLDKRFFSLGQENEYYEKIIELDLWNDVLVPLNDIANDNKIFRTARLEDVSRTSLFRSVSESKVLREFARIISGLPPLTPYNFKYVGPSQPSPKHKPIELEFQVEPVSNPPSNIHVLIGRNGVGKSFILNAMIRALVTNEDDVENNGAFRFKNLRVAEENLFSAVVSVTFSAFDKFEPLTDPQVTRKGVTYAYVGLKNKRKSKEDDPGVKDLSALEEEFSLSAQECVTDARLLRWQRALDMLESDPIFKTSRISDLADISDIDDFKKTASKRFRDLSSGHKIVLLTITKLVELVEERSLVVLDEPEAHLHPPLLSAFVRALSDLLNNRNGMAIIATHSPVVLQEVPSSCTWILGRNQTLMTANRSEAETFAENVGILTHRVFGLEVEEAGFYNLLRDAVNEDADYDNIYDNIMKRYDQRIGSEGRGLVRVLIALQNKMNKGRDRTVSQRDDGKWQNKRHDSNKATSVHDTQKDAEDAARDNLKNQGGGELITKGKDGKIRSKDTIPPGNDPNPPKDKEH